MVMQMPAFVDGMTDSQALRLAVATIGEMSARIAEMETQLIYLTEAYPKTAAQADMCAKLLEHARKVNPEVDGICVSYRAKRALLGKKN